MSLTATQIDNMDAWELDTRLSVFMGEVDTTHAFDGVLADIWWDIWRYIMYGEVPAGHRVYCKRYTEDEEECAKACASAGISYDTGLSCEANARLALKAAAVPAT